MQIITTPPPFREAARPPAMHVRDAVEIVVRLKFDPTALSELMVRVTGCRADVVACCSYHERGGTVVLLVTEDSPATMRALEAAGFVCQLETVVLATIQDEPALTARLGQTLTAAGIGLVYSYTYQVASQQRSVVFKTTDDKGALRLLQEYLQPGTLGLPALEPWSVSSSVNQDFGVRPEIPDHVNRGTLHSEVSD